MMMGLIKESREEMRTICTKMFESKVHMEEKVGAVVVAQAENTALLSTLNNKVSVLESRSDLEETVLARLAKVEAMQASTCNDEALEALRRESDLVIRGIPTNRREVQSVLRSIIKKIADALEHPLSDMSLERVRQVILKKHNGTDSILIARFSTRTERNAFFAAYFAKKSLSTLDIGFDCAQRIYINDNLTARMETLRLRAMELTHNRIFKKCQVFNGHVLLTLFNADERVHVHTADDLAKAVARAKNPFAQNQSVPMQIN